MDFGAWSVNLSATSLPTAIRVPEVFAEEVVEYARRLDRGERVVASDSVQNQKLLEMLKNALDVPTKSFGKGKVILREIVSILETAQNQ